MYSSQKNNSADPNNAHYKEWMHDLEEVAKVGRWEIDMNSNEVRWTSGVYRIFDIEGEPLPTLDEHFTFYLKPFREMVKKAFVDLIERDVDLEYEARIKSKTGKLKWVRVIGKKDKKSDSKKVFGTIQDITHYKEVELQKNILISQTEEMFILVSEKFEILTFNDQFSDTYRQYFGKKVEKGDSILDYTQPERVDEVRNIYKRVFEGEQIENELVFKPPGKDDERLFSFLFKPALGENGKKIVGAFVSIKDVTEQRKAQEQIVENERRFRSLVEQGSDGIAILDAQGNPTYVTPSIEKILGYTVEEIQKLNLYELLHPQDVPAVEKKVAESLEKPGELIQGHTSRMRHKDGSWRWIEAVITNLLDDPAVEGIVDNFRDVTDKIEAEKKLVRAHKKLSTHLENSPLGVIEYNKDLKITKWSDKCEQIFGWSEEEVLEQKFTAFDTVYKEDKQKVQDAASELISGTADGNISQNRNLTKDGRIIDCVWYNSVIKNEDGSVDTIMSLVEDITQSVKAKKELQKSNEEKSLMLSEIHHRVKNNLAIISGLMNLQAFKEKDEALVNVLLDSASRVRSIALVHEQLYSSQDFRSIRLDKNIINLVENISSIMGSTKDVETEYQLEPVELNINQAVPCALFINEAVTNVFKHAFDGNNQALLRIKCNSVDDYVQINIEDNGTGFDQPDNEKIDTLGLKLLEKVTEQLNGELSYATNPGTSVQLTFQYKQVFEEAVQ